MKMGETEVNESVVCYTQYCAISDYGKSFLRHKKFAKLIRVAHSSRLLGILNTKRHGNIVETF